MEGETVDNMTHSAEVVGLIATPGIEKEAQTREMAGQRFRGDADAVWKGGDLGEDGGVVGVGGERRGQAQRGGGEGPALRECEGMARWPEEGSARCPQHHPSLNRILPSRDREKIFSTALIFYAFT